MTTPKYNSNKEHSISKKLHKQQDNLQPILTQKNNDDNKEEKIMPPHPPHKNKTRLKNDTLIKYLAQVLFFTFIKISLTQFA